MDEQERSVHLDELTIGMREEQWRRTAVEHFLTMAVCLARSRYP
jgi:hypothetical protein